MHSFPVFFFSVADPTIDFSVRQTSSGVKLYMHTKLDIYLKTYSFNPKFGSEEHTSELQSLITLSYAVFCLKKKKNTHTHTHRSLATTQPNSYQPKKNSYSRLSTTLPITNRITTVSRHVLYRLSPPTQLTQSRDSSQILHSPYLR